MKRSSCPITASARCPKYHRDHPYVSLDIGTGACRCRYEPAESNSSMFGGNSNWRGPIWFPVNYLDHRIAAEVPPLLRRRFQGRMPDRVRQLCHHLPGRRRIVSSPDANLRAGRQAAAERSSVTTRNCKPIRHFRDYLLFYEYFNGDTGRGVGASHQTGWTGLIAKLLQPRREEGPEEALPAHCGKRPPALDG